MKSSEYPVSPRKGLIHSVWSGIQKSACLTYSPVILTAWSIGWSERNSETRHTQILWNMPPIKLLPRSKLCSYDLEESHISRNQDGCVQALLCHQLAAFQCPQHLTKDILYRGPALDKGIGSCGHFFNKALGNICVLLSYENVKSKLWSPLWVKFIQKII